MGELFTAITFVLGISLAFSLEKLIEYYGEKKISDFVSWTLSEKRRDYNLTNYIYAEQCELGLPDNYKISEEREWDYVRKILNEYQKNLAKDFFDGKLSVIRSKYSIPEDKYFIFTLQGFLADHECDHKFICYDMYKHIDSDNTSHYKEVELSEFSVVYHKLYLISYLSSTRFIAFNPQKKPAYREAAIRKVLDTKKMYG